MQKHTERKEGRGPVYRCVDCRFEIPESEAVEKQFSCCPNCESTGIPCHSKNDLTIRINWHEIRILCHWAMNYAGARGAKDAAGMTRTVKSIGDAIYEQVLPDHPGFKNSLFLFEELADVKKEFPTAEVHGHVAAPEDDLRPPGETA